MEEVVHDVEPPRCSGIFVVLLVELLDLEEYDENKNTTDDQLPRFKLAGSGDSFADLWCRGSYARRACRTLAKGDYVELVTA